jgi:hypothetical protein
MTTIMVGVPLLIQVQAIPHDPQLHPLEHQVLEDGNNGTDTSFGSSTVATNENDHYYHHSHPSQSTQQVLRGYDHVTAKSEPQEDNEDEFIEDDDDDNIDTERYILDYSQIDVQHSRKLVTIFDRPLSSSQPQQQQQQQRQQSLFSSFVTSRRRNIADTTWIIQVNSTQTTDIIQSKIVPNKIIQRLNLVFNGLIVKGISRSTLTWLLRRSDVLLIEEVRSCVLVCVCVCDLEKVWNYCALSLSLLLNQILTCTTSFSHHYQHLCVESTSVFLTSDHTSSHDDGEFEGWTTLGD